MEFQELIREIEENQWNIYGIRVKQNEKLLEEYGDCTKRHSVYSVTKTITSTAVGFAVNEQKFIIDKSLYDYIKDIIPDSIDERKREPLKKITIKRLLTMSIKDMPFEIEGENWIEYAINCIPEDVETVEFSYSNISAYLVGLALQCALSEHLIDYLMPRFFEPLGIEKPEYKNCPSGYFYGASGMKLSVEELEKIGECYLGNGIYQGKQIIPAGWVEEATKTHINNKEGGYGYFIWKYLEGYRISGKWGQRCVVMPKENMLITYLSDTKTEWAKMVFAYEKYILNRR